MPGRRDRCADEKRRRSSVFRPISGSQRVAPQPNGPVTTIPLAESRVGPPLKSCESPRRSGGAKTAVWGAGGPFQGHLGPFRRQVGYQNNQPGPTRLAARLAAQSSVGVRLNLRESTSGWKWTFTYRCVFRARTRKCRGTVKRKPVGPRSIPNPRWLPVGGV